MAFYGKAPIIKKKGKEYRDVGKYSGKIIVSWALYVAATKCLDPKETAAFKTILFLSGNQETFGVATKTICDRNNYAEKTYRRGRDKLAKRGWIIISKDEITIDYDKIYADLEELLKEKKLEQQEKEKKGKEKEQNAGFPKIAGMIAKSKLIKDSDEYEWVSDNLIRVKKTDKIYFVNENE